MSAPIGSLQANNFSERKTLSITEKTIAVPAAVLDNGRIRKQVSFRGNKSARFAEFENLGLAPQQIATKSLLNSAVAIDESGVVNYADLPDINASTAVERVETKITARVHHNPAITGYGRTNQDVYGALNLKRYHDSRTQARLQEKLAHFQAKNSRLKQKYDNRVLLRHERQRAERLALNEMFALSTNNIVSQEQVAQR